MDAREFVNQMTLREKAALCSGRGYWHTKAIKRIGLPAVMLADGPHGLRCQSAFGNVFGIGGSAPATCFPTASALACSFDPGLLHDIGAAIAEEAISLGVSVVLGPGVNIKRNPLGGRNFEYFSEDPELSGELGAAFVRGIQENEDGSPTGVGACVKHFAANSQERFRMVSDSVVDELVLREIYFPAFEKVVKEARPAVVMCSYNKLNGTYASENRWLLTDVLRSEWGFGGLVVSDWGATADRIRGLAAGLDLEMPGVGRYNTRRIMAAVRSGELAESVLDEAVARIIRLALAGASVSTGNSEVAQSGSNQGNRNDMFDRHHALARRAAAESAVLLKNEPAASGSASDAEKRPPRPVLPLASGIKLAIIGEMAKKPRYQGAGSSLVNPTRLENAWDELRKDYPNAVYASGYGNIPEAVAAASVADAAIVFAGLPDGYESEGYDRLTLSMPTEHSELIRAVCAANGNTVIVIQAGSPVDLSPADSAAAILYAWLGGQAGGGAVADILTGRVNPSGRLAETFPLRIEDTPSYSNFSTDSRTVEYKEGKLVGHRYYEAKGIPTAYPFGHGLSYDANAPTISERTESPLFTLDNTVGDTLLQESQTHPTITQYGREAPESPLFTVDNTLIQESPTHPRTTQCEHEAPGSSLPAESDTLLQNPKYTANSTLSDMKRTPIGAILGFLIRFGLTFVYGTSKAGRRMVGSIIDETPLRTLSPMSGGILPRPFIDVIIRLANIGTGNKD